VGRHMFQHIRCRLNWLLANLVHADCVPAVLAFRQSDACHVSGRGVHALRLRSIDGRRRARWDSNHRLLPAAATQAGSEILRIRVGSGRCRAGTYRSGRSSYSVLLLDAFFISPTLMPMLLRQCLSSSSGSFPCSIVLNRFFIVGSPGGTMVYWNRLRLDEHVVDMVNGAFQ
jgi:hypothetical protein